LLRTWRSTALLPLLILFTTAARKAGFLFKFDVVE
jgi:hypothetical protein